MKNEAVVTVVSWLWVDFELPLCASACVTVTSSLVRDGARHIDYGDDGDDTKLLTFGKVERKISFLPYEY